MSPKNIEKFPINGSLVTSSDNTAGVVYLDFYQNYLTKKIQANESFYSDKITVTIKGGYYPLLKLLKSYKTEIAGMGLQLQDKFIVKAFNNKYVNIDYGIGYVRVQGHSAEVYWEGEQEESDVEDDYTVFITGSEKFVSEIRDILIEYKKKINVSWYYMTNNGADFVDVEVKSPNKMFDEHYPYLKEYGGVRGFTDAFLKSTASIMILNGEPGTGKTSLIRDFICKNKLKTIVTYDERILSDERFFIDFLTNEKDDLLVIEDAELILTSRADAGNKLMSKLLGVSDGLVKLFNKKIIFTTNESRIQKFDEAILRPGRCFRMLNIRPLTLDEAVVVCDLHKLEKPTEKKTYTLAELFNQKSVDPDAFNKAGFF